MSRIEVCVKIKFVGHNLALLLTGFDWTGKMAFFTMFSGKMFFGIVFVGIRLFTFWLFSSFLDHVFKQNVFSLPNIYYLVKAALV